MTRSISVACCFEILADILDNLHVDGQDSSVSVISVVCCLEVLAETLLTLCMCGGTGRPVLSAWFLAFQIRADTLRSVPWEGPDDPFYRCGLLS